MHVREIEVEQFTVHDALRATLPSRGVLLVTGPNGAGKSSLVEAVAWAVWGRTLRGTPPWRGDARPPCRAVVRADTLVVDRTRTGAKTTLEWHPPGAALIAQWPTATKAQEALDTYVEAFDTWRRCSVFSSADAAHFTLATDGERKRFLEAVLGLGRFDEAYERAREAVTAAARRLMDAEREGGRVRARVAAAEEDLARAQATLEKTCLVEAPEAYTGPTAQAIEPLLAHAERELAAARLRMREVDRAGAAQDAVARAAQGTLTRIGAAAACPACTQGIPDSLRAHLGHVAREGAAQAASARAVALEAVRGIEALIVELEDEIAGLRGRIAAARTAEAQYAQRVSAHRLAAAVQDAQRGAVVHAEAEVQKWRGALAGVEEAERSAEADRAEAEAVAAVLGLRGVRAHLLATALTGLQVAANAWLPRLGLPGLHVELRPYAEKKAGGVTDAISIEVDGAGGGLGYRAASGGERRRLDVALLLALAEVAGAARGATPGTLWFDEVFDCLDEAGTEAVAGALQALAAERCVVVITHSRYLAACLPGAGRLELG